MPTLAEIAAAEAEWVRRFNAEMIEAVGMRDQIYNSFIEYLECTPDKLVIADVDEAEYHEVADQLQFFRREKLIRDNQGFWFAPMTLDAGLATLFLRIDFRLAADRLIIRDEAFDAEVSGSSEEIKSTINAFFDRLTTRLVEITSLPTWQKNLKEMSFRGFDR